MGGTSFDITLTKDGLTNLNKNIDFLRYRIGVPMIQVETLGAGGGSIGWIDRSAFCRSGRNRRAREPGPACYGQGGDEPTTSDANLVLGYLNPEGLLGGTLPLDLEKARAAIKKIADPLGISIERAAYGMFTIVNNNMVNGIRRVSVERGYDPRDFVLVGAGGATAAHITRARPRDGHRYRSSCRSSPRGSAPSARSSRTSNTTTWRQRRLRLDNAEAYRAHQHAVRGDRGARA